MQTRISTLLTEVKRCDQPWERIHAGLDALHVLHAIGEEALAARESVACETELADLAHRGTRLEGAEQRLRNVQREPVPWRVLFNNLVQPDEPRRVHETRALARLAMLASVNALT